MEPTTARSASSTAPPLEPDGASITVRAGPRGAPAQVARGFCMGTADLVPGVSGGTLALVLGIYVDLVEAVHDGAQAVGQMLRGRVRSAWGQLRAIDWWFLVPLLAGILVAVAVLAGPLSTLLEERTVLMSGLFFGLIVGSIAVSLHRVQRWDATRSAVFVGVTAATFWLLGIRGSGIEDPVLPVLVGGGALAACAMILPGISGSFVLLMLGLYETVLAAAHERDLVALAAVALGAAVGLALFSTALHWLLEHHEDTLMAALLGLMAGSLRVLWMWPVGDGIGDATLGTPVAGEVAEVIVAALAGAVLVVVLAAVGRRRERAVA